MMMMMTTTKITKTMMMPMINASMSGAVRKFCCADVKTRILGRRREDADSGATTCRREDVITASSPCQAVATASTSSLALTASSRHQYRHGVMSVIKASSPCRHGKPALLQYQQRCQSCSINGVITTLTAWASSLCSLNAVVMGSTASRHRYRPQNKHPERQQARACERRVTESDCQLEYE